MNVLAWIALGWLSVGALVIATRDPVGFAKFFWGALAIVLWPLALAAGRLVARRAATSRTQAPLPVVDQGGEATQEVRPRGPHERPDPSGPDLAS